MLADVLLEINPPVALDWRWWALAVALILVAIAVIVLGLLRWRSLGRAPSASSGTSLETLRQEALARVATARSSHHDGEIDAQRACQKVGRATRWFVGTACDGDADYETAAQLAAAARRNPRLEHVSRFITSIQDDCFSPTARPDVDAVAASAEEVIRQWH